MSKESQMRKERVGKKDKNRMGSITYYNGSAMKSTSALIWLNATLS